MWSACIKIAALMSLVSGIDYHDTLDDYYDFEGLLKNAEGLKSHMECYLEERPCDELQEGFRKHMRDVMLEACARCNDAQKHLINLMLVGLNKSYLDTYYKKWRQFYDPSGQYYDKLAAAVAGY